MHRPTSFDSFIGQEHITSIITTAVDSARLRKEPLGHMLFSGSSGYGKTTLATITAGMMSSDIKIITGYAITRPSELISLLHLLQPHDVLFIDEIHRLKAPIEEVLYTAMEDRCVDMVMPDGHHIRLPVAPFTLIGATTKSESLSEPLKNRFPYHFTMSPYTPAELVKIVQKYLTDMHISSDETIDLAVTIAEHIESVPRKVVNFCRTLKDYLVSTTGKIGSHTIDEDTRHKFRARTDMQKGGITPLHQRYLDVLLTSTNPLGLKTLSVHLGLSEKAIEQEIEPLLFSLRKIEKTPRGRIAV